MTGGYVYRGSAIPALRGPLRLRRLLHRARSGRSSADGARADVATPSSCRRAERHLASFGEDAAGELYLVSLDGSIYRFAAS